MNKISKRKVFEEWRNFLERSNNARIDFITLTQQVAKEFQNYFQKAKIKHTSIKNTSISTIYTFIIKSHYAYFDYDLMTQKEEERGQIQFKFVMGHLDNQSRPYDVDVVDFLYHYCNPEFIGILEKISWENSG